MSLNDDILGVIGSFCEPATYFSLCLVNKTYYQSQCDTIYNVYDTKIRQYALNVIDRCNSTSSSFSRLKIVHVHYRFMLKRKSFLQRHRKFIGLMLSKLDDYIIPNANGIRMGITPYRKYRKVLLSM